MSTSDESDASQGIRIPISSLQYQIRDSLYFPESKQQPLYGLGSPQSSQHMIHASPAPHYAEIPPSPASPPNLYRPELHPIAESSLSTLLADAGADYSHAPHHTQSPHLQALHNSMQQLWQHHREQVNLTPLHPAQEDHDASNSPESESPSSPFSAFSERNSRSRRVHFNDTLVPSRDSAINPMPLPVIDSNTYEKLMSGEFQPLIHPG